MATACALKRLLALMRSTRLLTPCPKNMIYCMAHVSSRSKTYAVHHVVVNTSINRWHEVPHGLSFRVAYIDTHLDLVAKSPPAPIVLLVHGRPGSHKDFVPLIDKLTDLGIRVIVPNFPGYGFTTSSVPEDLEIFSHSIGEQVEYLADFLRAIQVPRVDVAVGHSIGTTVVISLLATTDLANAGMLVCPVTHKPHKGIRPLSGLQLLSFAWEKKYLRPLLMPWFILLRLVLGFGLGSPYAMARSITTIANCDFDQVYADAIQVVFKKLPLAYAYSNNDHLIESSLSKEFGDILGISAQQFVHHNESKQVTSNDSLSSDGRHLMGLVLENGGHYPLKKFAELLADCVLKLVHAGGSVFLKK